jgi:hypothetical protein
MPEMQMSELKERLLVLAGRGPSRGADKVFEDASAALRSESVARVSTRSRRRIVVAIVAAAGVVGLAVSGVVWLRDDDSRPVVHVLPASDDLRDLYDTSDQAPLGDPLYLVPGYVPDGLVPFRVQGGDQPGFIIGQGGSPGTTRFQTFVKLDGAGRRAVGVFQVQWGPGATQYDGRPPGAATPTGGDPLAGYRQQSVPDRVRGRDALYAESLNSLAWEEPEGRMVAVSSQPVGGEQLTVDELHAVAESLVDSAAGFTVTDVPAGYRLVADAPGMGSFGGNAREVVYRAGDGRGFRVYIVDDSEMPPGLNLMPVPSIGGERDPHLVEVRGHHAVATRQLMSSMGFDQQTLFLRGADQNLQWLEPANVMVTVNGVGLSEDELLKIANDLEVVDRSGWEHLLVQAPGLGTGGTASPTEPEPVLEGDERAAADAFHTWISPGDLEQLVTRIEDGDALRDVLAESQTHVDPAATYEARVHEVRLVDPDHALVTFSLLRDGAALLANQQGVAVRIDGRWVVSRATYCAIVAMGGVSCPPA